MFTPLEQRFTPPPPEGPDYILPLESRCVPTCGARSTFLAFSKVEFNYVITNCFFGPAFEHKNSSEILKSFPKHQKSRKIPKNSRIFPKNSRLIQKNSRKNWKNSRIRQLELRWVGEIWPKKSLAKLSARNFAIFNVLITFETNQLIFFKTQL